MTASTDPKRQITVAASNTVRRMATKPHYVRELEQKVAKGPGPFDGAGGAFPFDVPSEAFDHHLRELDEALNRAEIQLAALRDLAASMRAIAEGKIPEPETDGAAVIAQIVADDAREKHDAGIHEPPPPPETPVRPAKAVAEAVVDSMLADGMEPKEIEATVTAAITMTWLCPEHGKFAEAVSRKGRPYRYCPVPDCGRLDIML